MVERIRLSHATKSVIKEGGLVGIADVALHDILNVQESYRSKQMEKKEAVVRITDRILQLHELLLVEPAVIHAEEKIAVPFNARILPRNSYSRHYADQHILKLDKRVATPFPNTNVIFAIFHPDVGMAVADYDTFNFANLAPTVSRMLENKDINIPNAYLGYDAIPMSDWVPIANLDATIIKTLRMAVNNFAAMTEVDLDDMPYIYFSGLMPWENFDLKKEFFPFIKKHFFELYPLKCPPAFRLFTSSGGNASGIIYGGFLDPEYSIPKFLTYPQ